MRATSSTKVYSATCSQRHKPSGKDLAAIVKDRQGVWVYGNSLSTARAVRATNDNDDDDDDGDDDEDDDDDDEGDDDGDDDGGDDDDD